MPYQFGDIPDSEEKPYIPMLHNIWKLYLELGWEKVLHIFEELSYNVYNLGYERLKNTVDTAKLIMEGVLEGTHIVNYSLSPPFYTIRNDLQSGSQKIIYGSSCDSTFVICNTFDDKKREIGFLMNCHLEDGFPIDWWTISKDDELLDRRHMKLGMKLRDLPAKGDYEFIGKRTLEILKDVRNERTPQWSSSAYFVGPCRMTGVMNCLLELSNYELFFHIYNSYNTKRLYKLNDWLFYYYPFPSLLYQTTFVEQSQFILRVLGLTTGHLWSIQGFHEKNIDYFTENFSEMWEILRVRTLEKDGIPIPQTTIEWKYPNIKNKKDFVKKFTRIIQKNQRITIDDLGIDLEDAYKGVFLDFTFQDPLEKISHDCIISIGMGKDAQILKENIDNIEN